MTEKHLIKNSKLKTLLVLFLTLLLSFTVLFITACGDEQESEEETVKYTKVENDKSLLTNGSFEFGVADVSTDDLPQSTSVTGWSNTATENSSTSSSVPSGIISVDGDAWAKTVKKLYDNSIFNSKINTVYGIDTDNKSEEEVISELKNKNPGTHDGAEGNKVYMLNAYLTSDKTAVTVSSSSSLSLKKGTYAKISFYVKAVYADGGNFNINFRLKNTLNSNSQSQYILSNISNDSWQQYTVYLKADENFDATITPVMSIGYTPKKDIIADYSEGTAFFDDIVYTEIEKDEYDTAALTAPIKNLDYNSKVYSNVQGVAANVFNYAYDLTVDVGGYFDNIDFLNNDTIIEITDDFTGVSETSYSKFGATSKYNAPVRTGNSISVDGIEYASVSIKLKDVTVGQDCFRVQKESYLLLSFDIENDLDRSGSTDITFIVYDQENNENNVVTYTNDGNTDKGFITIVNNDHDVSAPAFKTFSIVVVIGPTDVKNTTSMYDYASGSVALTNFKCATGKTYQYEKNVDGNVVRDPDKHETANYKFYSLFSSVASSVSIDNHHHESADTYYLSAAQSSGDGIYNYPVAISNYKGVSSNSIYIKNNGTDTDFNSRIGQQGDGDGNYAGLINSKVANDGTYETVLSGIKANLNYSGEKSIQTIMIYNNSADSYGFIGKSFTIAASAYAKISVKVKVVGDAKANVYLVNAADTDKSVCTVSFSGNVKGNSYNEKFSAPLAFTNITDTSAESNGWKTITFYIGAGATALDLRLELWNGSRDGAEKSQGYVFFAFDAFNDDESFAPSTLSSAFTEPTSTATAFTDSGNPLYGDNALRDNTVKYQRELDAVEIKYNKEYPNTAVSYDPTYVWAKSDKVLYAVLNTIDPVAVDPYASEEEETDSGCAAERDPSTFWLSFSSILLGVALVLALIMLIVKNAFRRRKSNKNDAKSHYVVSSRTSAKKKAEKPAKSVEKSSEYDGYEDEKTAETEKEESAENEVVESENTEGQQEEYVYGDVLDFGEGENTDKKAESTENTEQAPENNNDKQE